MQAPSLLSFFALLGTIAQQGQPFQLTSVLLVKNALWAHRLLFHAQPELTSQQSEAPLVSNALLDHTASQEAPHRLIVLSGRTVLWEQLVLSNIYAL